MDIDDGAMDGFVATSERPAGRGCGGSARVCASSAPPDVMGYHDAREIPNYWRWARDFTLQDHMFEPTASWSLPAHLFMVSGWSAHCTRGGDPSSCVNDNELGGFKTNQITGGRPGGPDGPAPALGAVTRCLERHGIRRQPYGLDLRQPHLPDALALCRHLAPPGAKGRLTEYGNYAWTDLTWLLHRRDVSWAYYIHDGPPPEPPWSDTPEIWNPLPSFTTMRRDGQVGNVKDVSHFLSAARSGDLPAVS